MGLPTGSHQEEVAPGVFQLETGRGITETNVYLVRRGRTGCWSTPPRRTAHPSSGRSPRPCGHTSRCHPADAHPPGPLRLRAGAGTAAAAPGPRAPGRVAVRARRVPPGVRPPTRPLGRGTAAAALAVAVDPEAGVPGLPGWECIPTPVIRPDTCPTSGPRTVS